MFDGSTLIHDVENNISLGIRLVFLLLFFFLFFTRTLLTISSPPLFLNLSKLASISILLQIVRFIFPAGHRPSFVFPLKLLPPPLQTRIPFLYPLPQSFQLLRTPFIVPKFCQPEIPPLLLPLHTPELPHMKTILEGLNLTVINFLWEYVLSFKCVHVVHNSGGEIGHFEPWITQTVMVCTNLNPHPGSIKIWRSVEEVLRKERW